MPFSKPVLFSAEINMHSLKLVLTSLGKFYQILIGKIIFLLQLAKEREDEMKEAREKEESLKAKKKSDPNALKVYTKGVGKFLNPTIKKEAR